MAAKGLLKRQLVPFAMCAALVLALVIVDTFYQGLGIGFWGELRELFGKNKIWNPHHSRHDLLLFFFFDAFAVYLFVLVITLVSYRYLYNFKMLLAGFLFLMTGIFNLVYFLTFNDVPAPERPEFHVLLYLLYAMDLLVVGMAPSYLPRVATQVLLAGFFMAKAVLVAWASWRLLGQKNIELSAFLQSPVTFAVLGVGAALAPLKSSVRQGSYYGGAVAGLALILLVAYCARREPPTCLETLLLLSIPLMLGIFVVLNSIVTVGNRVHYDPLMKIYNRSYCNSIVEGKAVSLGRRYCVALFDIDHFKAVNDRYGHMAGDTVLYHVGQKIRDVVLPKGIVCRYGGEEIIVFFPDSTPETSKRLAHDALTAVSRLKIPLEGKKGGTSLRVTVSGGIACGTNGARNVGQVIDAADKALYRSKQTGRNKLSAARKAG